MIRALVVGAAFFAATPALACPYADKAAYHAAAEKVQESQGDKAQFKVDGLTCGSCSDKVVAALEKIEGVFAAAVDYQTGEAHVAFDAKKTDPKALLSVISTTGFEAQPVVKKQG